MKHNLAKVELITASVIFGTIAVFRKAVPLNSGMLSMFRGFIGSAVLFLILLCKKQKLDLNTIKKNIGYLVTSGAAIGINWILCFESYRYTSVAISTLCYYMAPSFIIIASVFVLHEPISKKNVICILIALFGMFLVSGFWNETTNPKQIIGITLSVMAAVLYSTDVICNKKMSNIGALDRTIVQLFVAGLVTIPYVFLVEEPVKFDITIKIIFIVFLLGALHTGVGFALYFDSLSKLDTKTVAFFTYIDPILAVILSAVLLKEGISWWVVAGAVCIIGSALYNEVK